MGKSPHSTQPRVVAYAPRSQPPHDADDSPPLTGQSQKLVVRLAARLQSEGKGALVIDDHRAGHHGAGSLLKQVVERLALRLTEGAEHLVLDR